MRTDSSPSPEGGCELIIPLRESLAANLPPPFSSQSTHQPFPAHLTISYGEILNLGPTADNKWVMEFLDKIDGGRPPSRPPKPSIRATPQPHGPSQPLPKYPRNYHHRSKFLFLLRRSI
ncbi:hypothetical protein Agabi119p4_3294 [Agaricus bisporus var. burnettii]|uniref:Uncharacterized protein n=1 Tax=Agaricus bisporus var. burnettii TaxID=192524 RepID=A0A8H7F6Z8_AGABI|nr:hypothetical protein Agabi119p4_3294 [Agaricus bisporus var. burnettii]